MSGPTIFDRETSVSFWFGSSSADEDVLILDHPTQGLLDTGGVLDGDIGTDLAGYVYDIRVTRGRSRELDETNAGTCTVRMRNQDRALDPLNAEYVVTSDGAYVVDADGAFILLDGSMYAPALVPGTRMRIQVYGQTIYEGTTEDWQVRYEPGLRTDVSVLAVDNLGALARRELDEWTTTPTEMAGARIDDVLNRPEVSFPYSRDFDTGVSTLMGDTVREGTNALDYVQRVVKTDYGMLFASRDNVLTFRDRFSRITETTAATFSTTSGEGLPIHGIALDVGSARLHNIVSVTREGDDEPLTAEDTESQVAYGIRKLSLTGMLMGSRSQARSLAEFLLALYSEPSQRISSIRVNLSALASQAERAQVAALDIGSVIDVTAQPLRTGVTIEQPSVIEGIEHTLSHGQPHYMTLQLSPVEQSRSVYRDGPVFLLDDAVYGELDSDDALLAFI